MEDFFKKVDKRAAESADEVMAKYTQKKQDEPKVSETRVNPEP
jgi:hypothetical protein